MTKVQKTMTWLRRLSVIAPLLSVLGGAYLWHEATYAKAHEVFLVSERLEQKIQEDKVDKLTDRKLEMQKQFPDIRKAPEAVKDQYRRNDAELDKAQRKLDKMEERMKQQEKKGSWPFSGKE